MVAPVVHDAPDVGEAPEPVPVQAAVPELAVEALHEGVLGGLAGLDEVQGRAGPLAPKAHRLAGELGAVVADDGLGRRRGLAQLVKEERQLGPRGRSGHQLAGHEAGRPALVRPGRHGQRNPRPPRPPAPLGSDLQAKPRAGAALALAGRHQALALQHVVQRQVAITGVLPGQLAQAVRQRPVAALRIRTAPGRRAVKPQQAAYPPFAGRAGLPEAARRLPLGGGRHHFFDVSMTSSSIRMAQDRVRDLSVSGAGSPYSTLEPLQVGRRHASVLGLPAVDRLLGDAMLAGQVGRRGAGLALVEDRDGLFFRVSLAFHAMSSLGSG